MSHNKTWACINPCGDGCDGDHTPENIESADSRTRELEAALSVARDALKRLADGVSEEHPTCMSLEDGSFGPPVTNGWEGWARLIRSQNMRIAREALRNPAIQKEAERIRAMEEVVEAARRVFKGYKVYDGVGNLDLLKDALQRLDEREG